MCALSASAQERGTGSAFHLLDPPDGTIAKPSQKRFFAAAGELLVLEVGPWAFDRYVLNEDFSHIDFGTIRENFRQGFAFDNDDFTVNQSFHPYHGNLFFNAARTNGFNFWQSAPFALAGSLMWECCMENTRPSWNDLVNTTLGGIVRGEIAYRVSSVLFDDTATGFNRFLREVAGTLYDPVHGFNRIVRGDAFRVAENPPDRYPSRLWITADLGYRHIEAIKSPDRGFVTLRMVYGDPFAGRISVPFQFFDFAVEAQGPQGSLVSLISERGILGGWQLASADAPVQSLLGVFMHFDYVNNESQVVGAQRFSLGLISTFRLPKGFEMATDVALVGFPLEGVKTTDFTNPQTGRNYDYAPGGGARAAIGLRRKQFDFLSAAYGVTWDRTVSGPSRGSELQYFYGDVRARLSSALALGAGYRWYSRLTTYPGFAPDRKTQGEWRAFVTLRLGRDFTAKGTPPPKAATP